MFRGPFRRRDKRVAGRLRNGDRCSIYVLFWSGFPGVDPRVFIDLLSTGAGDDLALVPPAIILVITCAVTGISAAMVIWLSEKAGNAIVPVLWLCRWCDRHVEPGRRFSNAFKFHVVFRRGRILGRPWLLDSRRKARRSRRRLARRSAHLGSFAIAWLN